jgi:hypothetical protein
MKRFTRMLSAVLALATVCAASFIPAYADGETEGTATQTLPDGFYGSAAPKADDALTSLPITATFGINSTYAEGLIPNAVFHYTLTPDDPDKNETSTDGLTISKGVAFSTEATTTWTVVSKHLKQTDTSSAVWSSDDDPTLKTTANPTGGLSIPLDIPAATKSGIYRYTLEQKLDDKSIANTETTYDSTKFRVNLYVNNDDGKSAYVYMIQVYKPNTAGTGYNKAVPKFENTVRVVEDLIVKDVVVNNVTSEDVGFTIKIKVPEKGDAENGGMDLTPGTDLGAYVLLKDGKTKVDCTGTKDEKTGRTYPKVVVSDAGIEITLYDGESLVVPGVPLNMIYSTVNTEANTKGFDSSFSYAEGYKSGTTDDKDIPDDYNNPTSFVNASVTKTEDGKTVVTADKVTHDGQIKAGQNAVIYYNVNKTLSATGIAMDTAPYIVMFVAAAGLAVLSLAKKKINR